MHLWSIFPSTWVQPVSLLAGVPGSGWGVEPNNSMQRTGLRAAAGAGR
jgi:hypothetical protein